MSEPSHAPFDQPSLKHGQFCWTEIASSDAGKCREFYSEIFGWKFLHEGGPDAGLPYHEFSTGGNEPVGGMYAINPEWFDGNPPPPHFMSYVAVDDVDQNAKVAEELGATITRGPMDVPGVGRMCILQDPTGAMIATFKFTNKG